MTDEKRPFNNPFGALAGLKASLPEGAAAPTRAEKPPKVPARAVLRLERKGRRGKEVTVVEALALGEAEREAWLREVKAALGCGGAVEGEALVLQGDQRQRAAAWLSARGVGRVVGG